MMMHQTLTQLRTLKLDGFADGLEEQLTQPGTAALSFEERLSLLVDREASWRDDRRRTRLLKQAEIFKLVVASTNNFRLPFSPG
nr:ATP-binding protein [Caballeronia sp. Lep1P3]